MYQLVLLIQLRTQILQKIKTFVSYFTCNFFCQFESFCIKTRTLYFGSIHIRRCASYLLYLRVHFFSNFSCSILAVSKWSVLCKRKKSHKQTKKHLSIFGIFFILMFFWSVPNDSVSLLSYMLEFINNFCFVVFLSYLKQLSCHFIFLVGFSFFKLVILSLHISVNWEDILMSLGRNKRGKLLQNNCLSIKQ